VPAKLAVKLALRWARKRAGLTQAELGPCCPGGPFGAHVFPSDGASTIYDDYNAIYSASPGTPRRTIVMPTTGEQSHPSLSPEGSTIVLQATCGGDNAARSIWTVPATSTTPLACTGGRRLSPQGTDATHASWGPNGMIAWGSVAGGNNSVSPVPSSLVIWRPPDADNRER